MRENAWIYLYGFGLGCNTMEGREHKHQRIAKYAENTTVQNRWPLIFRHEFIQLVHLRENGFDKKRYCTRANSYVPTPGADSCSFCGMSTTDDCKICDSHYMKTVISAIDSF